MVFMWWHDSICKPRWLFFFILPVRMWLRSHPDFEGSCDDWHRTYENSSLVQSELLYPNLLQHLINLFEFPFAGLCEVFCFLGRLYMPCQYRKNLWHSSSTSSVIHFLKLMTLPNCRAVQFYCSIGVILDFFPSSHMPALLRWKVVFFTESLECCEMED